MQIDDKPDAGFNDPLGLLSDCHRRIERFLGGLVRVTDDLRGGALDDRYRKALETCLHYFQEAAPRHTADEEESLFPRLRASADPRAVQALERIAALEAEHHEVDAVHAEVNELVARWLSAGTLAEADRLRERLAFLEKAYGTHIAIEDDDIFPMAKAVLKESDLAAVGREMARRRGLYAELSWLPEE